MSAQFPDSEVFRQRTKKISPKIFLVLTCLLLFQVMSSVASEWEPIGPRGASVVAMTRVPGTPTHVYACTFSGGLYESVNAGLSWSFLPTPFSNQYIFDVLIDPASPDTLYAGLFQDGIFKSTDAGVTWATVNTGLDDMTVLDLEMVPSTGTLLAATKTGVYYSTNGGGVWTLGVDAVESLFATGLYVDALDGTTSYAMTTGHGIYQSVDSGVTWTLLSNGLLTEGVNHLTLDVRDQAWMYAATGSSVYRIPYSDFKAGAGAWENIGFNLEEKSAFDVLTLPNTNILVALHEGVYEFDGVDTWNIWADIPARLLFSTSDGGVIHVAGSLDVLSVTADQGANFYPANWGIQNRFVGALETIDVFGWTVIYGGTEKGLELTSEFFRTDDSLPWILARQFDSAIFDIDVVESTPSTFYIGTERNGVWKATNYGNQWESKSNGMVPSRINSLAQSKTDNQKLYAGTSAGLYTSTDQGVNWFNTGNTDNPKDVTTIAAHTESDLIVFYGTRAGQVFLSFTGGADFLPGWPGIGVSIRNIIIAPYQNIYLTLENGDLYFSTDNGIHFFAVSGMSTQKVVDVAVDPVRPWIAYAATTTDGIYRTEDAGFNWVASNTGLTDLGIISIDISYTDDQLLYTGSTDEVHKSIDGGQTWTSMSNGLPAGLVTRIDISDSDNSTVYAVVDETTIYRTINGGTLWELFYDDSTNGKSLPLLEDQGASTTLYRGTHGLGVYKSVDSGTNWTASSEGMRLFVRSLKVSDSDVNTIYAGTLNGGVFKTVDGGGNWDPIGLDDRNIFKIYMDPVASNIVYTGASIGISKSVDSGATWQDLGQHTEYFFDLIIDPLDSTIIYGSGLGGKVVVSTDNGLFWKKLGGDLPKVNMLAIALDSPNGILYVAPEFEGIYKSGDGGMTWSQTGLGFVGLQISCMFVAGNGDVFVGTQADNLYRSTDNGTTFTQLSVPIANEYITDINSLSGSPATIIVSTISGVPGNNSMYSSADGGENWTIVSTSTVEPSIVTFTSTSGGAVVYATSLGSFFQSVDGMNTWQKLSDYPVGSEARSIALSTFDADTIFVGTSTTGVLKSVDGGVSWSLTPDTTGLSIGKLAIGTGGVVWAGTLGEGIIFSDDDGSTWSMGADTGLINSPVLDVVVNKLDPDVIYAATGGSGVHKSIDGGSTWAPMNTGLTGLNLLVMIIDQENPQILYVGSSTKGVFRTSNGGATWAPINDGLFNLTITSLSLDANDHTILYVGTEGGGAFRLKQ